MIKLILTGLWVCLVTLGSTFAIVSWPASTAGPQPPAAPAPAPASPQAHAAPTPAHGPPSAPLAAGMEMVKTRMISVPIVTDNAVQGYVMAQFAFVADSKTLKHLAIKPDVFLVDEAHKAIFSGGSIDFRQFTKQDLRGLTKEIAGAVNKRLGTRLIEDVLVQELNFIPKDQVRAGQKY
jgi:hypothetical protein